MQKFLFLKFSDFIKIERYIGREVILQQGKWVRQIFTKREREMERERGRECLL